MSTKSREGYTKLHVIWNICAESIESFRITGGRVNDSPQAKRLKIRPNCTYIFDRAYNELLLWWIIVDQKSHFVSRLKKNSYNTWKFKRKLTDFVHQDGVLWEQDWKPSHDVLRKNPQVPKDFKLRQIAFRCPDTKKVFNFITSDFESPSQEIADIYKKRWAVELLFRWLKGHLNIRSLEPRNTNSIRIRLAIAVLVQLLIQLFRLLTKFSGTLWECLRKLRTDWLKAAIEYSIQNSLIFDLFATGSAPAEGLSGCYP
jgi:putative transposase